MAGAGTAIQLSGFREAQYVFEVEAPLVVEEEVMLLAVSFAEETKKRAQANLDRFVYDLPEPQGYMRTHRTYNAIKAHVFEAGGDLVAEAYVDRDNFNFPYYLVLEDGLPMDKWFWWGKPPTGRQATFDYRPRPFWRTTEAEMRVEYRTQEEAMLRSIITRINGRFA